MSLRHVSAGTWTGWGVEIPGSVRERVTGCTDLDVLGTRLDHSLSVTRAEELFVEE
ncbi:hypothetical protein [Streptomyces sp. NPDC003730]